MESAISQLNYLPETREQQKTFVHKAIEELMNGEHDIMKFWIQASIVADTLNEIKDSILIKKAAIEEARKYKDQPYMGCKISVVSRKTFDFSKCNYSPYIHAKGKLATAKDEVNRLESFLKNMQLQMGDPVTGEILNPPTFTESEYITVK